MTPNQKAFLDMIAWAEGTDNGVQHTDNHGYDVIVGGSNLTDYSDHPRKLIYLKRLNVSSDAAGRYQLLSPYFDAYKRQLGLTDFGPASQDAIALQQIKERKALLDIESGNIQSAIYKCSNIWASLPGNDYGQHQQSIANLIAAYTRAGGSLTSN